MRANTVASELLVTVLRMTVVLLIVCNPTAIKAAEPTTPPSQLVRVAQNPDWQISIDGAEAVYTGDSKSLTPTLQLDRAQLLQGDVTFIVTTDAPSCVIAAGETALELPCLLDKPTELTCVTSTDMPSLGLNGAERPAVRGKWIAICRKVKTDNVSLGFVGGSYVNVRIKGAAPQLISDAALTTRPAPALGPADASPQQMIDRVQTGVFQIIVKNTQKFGTGFVLSSDGFAATNYHVIQGATTVVGVFSNDKEKEIPIELWDARPEYDLALIKLDWRVNRPTANKVAILEFEKRGGKVGDEVRAFGYPEMGFSVNHGYINGTRLFKDLPAEVQTHTEFKRYSGLSEWLQTDCTINYGNSGGPLINANGKIVGISTWQWPSGNNIYFALSARHLQELYDQRPATALTFKEAAKKYGEDTGPQGSFPKTAINWD
ncbi:MAG: serine protease [Phycisphaerae bacterium]